MIKKAIQLFSLLMVVVIMLSSCAPAAVRNKPPVVETQIPANTEPVKTPEPEPKKTETPPAAVPSPASQVTPPPQPQPQTTRPQPQPTPPPEPDIFPPLPADPPVPAHKYQDLAVYLLDLINKDRAANGLGTVTLAGNTAAQKHAEECLANSFSSHWGLNGSKPYMRYTISGGVNYVNENVLGTGTEPGSASGARDIKDMIKEAEQQFMNSPGHRANILNKWHKKVSLGIAYSGSSLSIVQHFEGDYIRFRETPTLSGSVLSMNGKVSLGAVEQIVVYYDPLPETLSPEQLNAPPYDSSYSMGGRTGSILPPPPPGSQYTNLSPADVVAVTWRTQADGSFAVKADIGAIIGRGKGVYTIAVVVKIVEGYLPVSNYSIFIQ